jgi:ABC-2 type transport system permease protein
MRSLRIILFLAGKQLRILSRMRAILAVIFLPGIVLYTVFTLIFAGPAGRPFRVAVVDLDNSPESARLIEMLEKNNVKVVRTENEEADGPPLTVETARYCIRKKGRFRVALVVPAGFSEAPNVLSGEAHQGIQLHFDETQEMEAQVVAGIVQMAAGRALFAHFENLLPSVETTTDAGQESPSAPEERHPGADTSDQDQSSADAGMLIKIEKHGLAPQRMKIAAKHTFLAGLVPLFLLFGSTGAARGLLEELHSGEIRRLLAAPILPAHILLGQLLNALVVAMLQCYVMYIYAWLVFDVAIWEITGGLLLLTVATCLATTAFGMLMASLCSTCEQLDGLGTMVILAMSAVGGSMIPRFVMPAYMQSLGLFTINGWAYDGFVALIRHEGLAGIWPSCLVLTCIAAACATVGSIILTKRLRRGPGS